MMLRTRILIVDDQPRARQSLRALLATCPTVETVGEAGTGSDALVQVKETRPDLVLMDARMPGMDGIEATRLIKTRWPQIRVVVLSMYTVAAADAMDAGADAFLTKGAPAEELLQTLSEFSKS